MHFWPSNCVGLTEGVARKERERREAYAAFIKYLLFDFGVAGTESSRTGCSLAISKLESFEFLKRVVMSSLLAERGCRITHVGVGIYLFFISQCAATLISSRVVK
jgi:hypothetical protein